MGLEPGDRVAIMSETRQEWVVADMGIVTARLVTAPIYPTLSGQQARFILQDSGARGVFVSDVTQAEKILAVRHLLPALEFIVVFTDEMPPAAVRGSHTVLRLEGLIERGRALASDPAAVARYEAGIDAVAPDDLLTIIYTSGTTGEPKGVMLTHDNVLSNIAAVIPVLGLDTGDVALSYLPLSHVFERMVTYLYLYEGLTVCHAESMDTLARDLQLVRPTVMTGVPRVYEKLHAKIHETVAAGPAFRRRLFDWAVRIGTDASAARRDGPRAVAVPEDAGGRRRRTGRLEDPREGRRTAAPRGVWKCAPAGAHRTLLPRGRRAAHRGVRAHRDVAGHHGQSAGPATLRERRLRRRRRRRWRSPRTARSSPAART